MSRPPVAPFQVEHVTCAHFPANRRCVTFYLWRPPHRQRGEQDVRSAGDVSLGKSHETVEHAPFRAPPPPHRSLIVKRREPSDKDKSDNRPLREVCGSPPGANPRVLSRSRSDAIWVQEPRCSMLPSCTLELVATQRVDCALVATNLNGSRSCRCAACAPVSAVAQARHPVRGRSRGVDGRGRHRGRVFNAPRPHRSSPFEGERAVRHAVADRSVQLAGRKQPGGADLTNIERAIAPTRTRRAADGAPRPVRPSANRTCRSFCTRRDHFDPQRSSARHTARLDPGQLIPEGAHVALNEVNHQPVR